MESNKFTLGYRMIQAAAIMWLCAIAAPDFIGSTKLALVVVAGGVASVWFGVLLYRSGPTSFFQCMLCAASIMFGLLIAGVFGFAGVMHAL